MAFFVHAISPLECRHGMMNGKRRESVVFIEQEFHLWKMTYDLVLNKGFQVLHMNTQAGEVWLEKQYKRKNHVVRMKHKQINWRSEWKRDLEITLTQLNQNKQLFRGAKVVFHSIYISEHPPVDDWEDVSEITSSFKTTTELYYLHDENKREGTAKFYDHLGLTPMEETGDRDADQKEAAIPQLQRQIVAHHERKKQEVQELFGNGKPFVTYLLLAVNVALFLLLEWAGGSTNVETLIEYGAKFNPAIMEGEWWRLVTSMFLHIGLIHLMMNMLALYYIGTAVERIYGSWRYIIIYLLAGVFGSVASFMLNPQVSAGASGAIFGLFGALLYFGVWNRRLFFQTMGWNLLFIIGLNIAFGLFVPQIDNGAHMGGLIGGFIAAAISQLPKQKRPGLRTVSVLVFAAALGAMVLLGWNGTFNGGQVFSEVQKTQELNEQGEFQEVIDRTTDALEAPDLYEAELLFNRSYAYFQEGETALAEKDLNKVVDLAPEMAEAHYNLALLYEEQGDIEKAASHAREAAHLVPGNEDFHRFYQELNQ